MQFLYENGLGHIVDKHRAEPMNLFIDEKRFAIETISSQT